MSSPKPPALLLPRMAEGMRPVAWFGGSVPIHVRLVYVCTYVHTTRWRNAFNVANTDIDTGMLCVPSCLTHTHTYIHLQQPIGCAKSSPPVLEKAIENRSFPVRHLDREPHTLPISSSAPVVWKWDWFPASVILPAPVFHPDGPTPFEAHFPPHVCGRARTRETHTQPWIGLWREAHNRERFGLVIFTAWIVAKMLSAVFRCYYNTKKFLAHSPGGFLLPQLICKQVVWALYWLSILPSHPSLFRRLHYFNSLVPRKRNLCLVFGEVLALFPAILWQFKVWAKTIKSLAPTRCRRLVFLFEGRP